MAINNELQVRLLHAAKTRDGWASVESYPKRGEVCLEAENTSGSTSFKIKIGDGTRPYCRYDETTGSWDYTSDSVLPYFGTVVTTSGTPQVCTFYTYTSGDLNGTTVIRIYDLALSSVTTSGETTITLNTSNYREIRPGSNIAFNATSDSILTIAANMDFSSLDTDSDIALAEWHEADPQVSGDTNAIRIYEIKEVNGVISKGTNFIAIKVSSPLEISNTNGVITISIQDASTSQKGAVQLLNTYTKGDGGNYNDSTKATTNKAITEALKTLDGSATIDNTTNSLAIISTVSETDGIVSSTKKTLTAGDKINITVPTEGTDAGKIIINHETVASPIVTQGTQDIPNSYKGDNEGEKETLVITDVTTDGYGHITSYKSEASTNLIAADIKAPVTRQDNSVWNFRETGGDITIGEDTARISSLKGNTIIWNQLASALTSSVTLVSEHKYYTVIGGTKSIQTGAGSAIPVTGDTDMVVDLTKMFGATIANSMTVNEFEKLFPNSYYPYCEGRLVNLGGYGVKWNQLYDTEVPIAVTDHKYYLSEVVSSTKTSSISTTISYTSGSTNRMCIDLTLMFGPGSEPTLEEFEAMFPNDYYEYNAGTEMNIFDAIGDKKLGLESTGFNQWDEEWDNGYWDRNLVKHNNSSSICGKTPITVFPSEDYYYKHGGGYAEFRFADSDNNLISTITDITLSRTIPIPPSCKYAYLSVYGRSTYTNNICFSIYDESRKGEYEPYKKDTLDLDWIQNIEYTPTGSSTPEKLFPYGLLSVGSVHDEVTETKAIKRVGVRDYQSGDESDSTVITDGNKTHYALSTSIEIPLTETHRMSYAVDDHGTEQQLPVNVSSVINAPFVGTFEYLSNFKDAVRDLFNQVNNTRNHVKGVDNTSQTVGKLAIYDSTSTVKSSNYSVLPSGDPFKGSTTNILLPTAEQIITYVNNVVASTLTYKGTVSTWAELPTSGQSNGDLWIASAVIKHEGNTYYPGTFFIWNSGDSTVTPAIPAHWDIVSSNTSVSDNNPYLWVADPISTTQGKQYKVGTINGTDVHVRVPELPNIAGKQTSGNVLVGNGTGENDNTASWRGLKLDETVNNDTNNTPIAGANGTNTGVLVRSNNGQLTNNYQWEFGDPSAINLINPTNSAATSGKVLVGNYNASSETHTTPPSWRNLKLDELSYNGTNLIHNLGTGLLKRKGNDDWELTEESLVWKTTSGTTNFDAISSDGTSLTNKIHNYTNVTTIELGHHNDGSADVVDGFRINVPLITSNYALSGLVLQGNKVNSGGTVSGGLPSWERLKVDDLDDIYNIINSQSTPTPATTGYLKRIDNGASATTRYTWEFDPYGGSSRTSSYADGTEIPNTDITVATPNKAGLKEQTGSSTYAYKRISFAAITNDASTGDSAVTIILNGNFS